MNTLPLLILASLTTLLTFVGPNASARAGGFDSGGGVAYMCEETPQAQSKIFLADSFEILKNELMPTAAEQVSSEKVLEIAFLYLQTKDPLQRYPHPFLANRKVTLSWMVEYTWANLRFDEVYQELPALNDDHIDPRSLPSSCKKVQFAIQNLRTRHVAVNAFYRHKLSPLEDGLFQLHETFIALRNAPGEDTTGIRKQVADLMSDPNQQFARELRKQITFSRAFYTRFCGFVWDRSLARELFTDLICGIFGNRENFDVEDKKVPNVPVEWPAKLRCQIESVYKKNHEWSPRGFDLELAGTGKDQRYQFVSNGRTTGPDDRDWTSGAHGGRHDPHREPRERFRTPLWSFFEWQGQTESKILMILQAHQERIRLFTGTIAYDDATLKAPSQWRWDRVSTEYGIACIAP